MTRSLRRRAHTRLRVVATAVMLLMLGLGSEPPVSARSDPDRDSDSSPADGGCGTHWGSAQVIDTLDGNLLEVSGFVSSARYPGVAWMIRDSQNPDHLYSFQMDGDRTTWKDFPISGSTTNRDWEDVTYTLGPDGRGRLWVLENDFAGGPASDSSMKVYEVMEPDPHGDTTARLAGSYRVAYPGGNLNTESIFALGGRLYVATRTVPNRVFRLPWPLSPSGTNHLVEVGRLDGSDSLITAIAVSGDDRLLATMSTGDDVQVFERRTGADAFSAFSDRDPVFRRSMADSQRESLDFFPYSGCDLVSVSEDGTVWRLSNPRTIQPSVQPGAPTNVTATPGDGSATVSWTPPADTGAAALSGYMVTARRDSTEAGTVRVPDGAATKAVVTGLANGVAHTFTVTAFNGSGQGPPSAPTPAVTPGPAPPAPPAGGSGPGPAGPAAPTGPAGYWMLGADGAVYAFGDSPHLGSASDRLGGVTAVDLEPTPSAAGYWVVDDGGGVHVFGDARHHGQIERSDLGVGETVTSLSATPAGDGYWLFTSRGRVVPFGSARPYGDLVRVNLNRPILDSVATPTGLGYYMVASDGGIFTFGDARFFGSMGGTPLNAPVQSLVPDGDGAGYWLVASDGGIFAFEAPFRGSLGGVPLNRPITGMVRFGDGYLMVGEDGGIFNFSDRPFVGSLGDKPPARPIVSVAALD